MATQFTTDDKISVATQALQAGIATLIDSASWKAYLNTQAKFHRYSPTNTMLIFMQRPDATHVAGYQKWLELKRQVRLGEKGIFIMAPSFRAPRVRDDEDPETTIRTARTPVNRFHVTHVFDISQTEGKELPRDPSLPAPAAAEDLFPMIKEAAHRTGLPVIERKMRSTRLHGGLMDDGNGSAFIELNLHFDEADRACTLVHEIGHYLLNHLVERPNRPDAELEAESVAYIVLHAFGIDCDTYAFGYIAGWQKEDQKIKGALAGRLGRIARVARTMIDSISNIQQSWANPDLEQAA
jgi:hypothetical protein